MIFIGNSIVSNHKECSFAFSAIPIEKNTNTSQVRILLLCMYSCMIYVLLCSRSGFMHMYYALNLYFLIWLKSNHIFPIWFLSLYSCCKFGLLIFVCLQVEWVVISHVPRLRPVIFSYNRKLFVIQYIYIFTLLLPISSLQ